MPVGSTARQCPDRNGITGEESPSAADAVPWIQGLPWSWDDSARARTTGSLPA
jgi:hypothetical protein